MELEQLIQKGLAPFRCLDDRLQREYARHGQELSDTMLYPVTFGLCTIGLFVGATPLVAMLRNKVSNPYLIGAPFGLFGVDFYYNTLALGYTLAGYSKVIRQQPTSDVDSIVHYPIRSIIAKCRSINKVIRLPTMFLSFGLTGKGVYEGVASFFGRISSEDPFVYIAAGIGFLATASSMYLKERTNTAKQ